MFMVTDQGYLFDVEYLERNCGIADLKELRFAQAEDWDRAIVSLQSCLATTSNNAAIYSYLGDVYLRRGEREVARRCYLEACLVDPGGIDWERLEDQELLSPRASLEEESGRGKNFGRLLPVDAMPCIGWLPHHLQE